MLQPFACLCPQHTDHGRCLPGCACGNGRVARRADGGRLEVTPMAPKKDAESPFARQFRRG